MENPNPILYSDLIKPDNSITTLIAQLDELIKKYETVKTAIQQSAADTAKSLQQVSGATQEQRLEIEAVSKDAERLAAEYKKLVDQEKKEKAELASKTAARREANMIAKLEEQRNRSLAGSYNRLSAEYRLAKIRLNEMSAEQRKGTIEGQKLERQAKAIYEEMSRLQEATGKYQLNVGHYQNAWKGMLGPLGQVGSAFSDVKNGLTGLHNSSIPMAEKALVGFGIAAMGVVAAVAALSKAVVSLMQKLGEFEQANVNLSTILGTDREGMRNLTDAAKRLGATTAYTATQVTELQTELAKLGFSQGQIIAMEKSVLDFATAMGVSLGEAAQVAGATLRAFGYTSEETEEVLSTLVAACNNSALSFDKIQTSIGNVFPIAAQFGFSVKDTATLLGALANAGMDASTAATATRKIISEMADPTSDLAKRLGRTVHNVDELMDALIELRKGGLDLAESLDLVGQRAVTAFAAFVSGAESAKELRDKLEDVGGTAARIADERLQTLQGSIELLKSSWNGLLLELENTTGVAQDVIIWLTKITDKVHSIFWGGNVFVSEQADTMAKNIYAVYSEQGEEAAKAFIKRQTDYYESQAENLKGSAKKNAQLLLEAWNKAAEVSSDRIATNVKENVAFVSRQADLMANDIYSVYSEQGEKAAKAFIKKQTDYYESQAENLKGSEKRNAQLLLEAWNSAIELSSDRMAKNVKATDKKAADAAKKQRIADLQAVINAIDLEIAITDAGTDKMLELRQAKLTAQLQLELEQNRQKVASERLDEEKINAKYDKQRLEAVKTFNDEVSKLNVQRLQAEQGAIQLELATIDEGSEQALELKLRNIEIQRDIEIEQNRQKNEDIQQDEQAIILKYQALIMKEAKSFRLKVAKQELEQIQELNAAEFDLLDRNERQKTLFRLEQEKARLKELLRLQEEGLTTLSDAEIATIRAQMAKIDQERSRLGYNNLYELMGLSIPPEQQDALNTAIDSVKDALSSLADSWNQAAEAALNAANAQVEAAQKVLDAEIEAREKGYANRVESAQKELALAQKTQESARKEQEKAQKAQLALDSLQQASSLVTATANIWKAFSGAGAAGLIAAALATATMWGSFAAAKIKASQVAGIEQYGEGTVELLQGGSHSSGHDIDLGRRSNGVRRRAEGGEYFAIINKRNSRRYRDVIPDVINSFNDGTFADKYARANETMSSLAVQMMGGTDVSRLEKDVSAIKRQGEESRFVDGQGNTIVKYRNLTRKIKN